jgi:hypothetical protein
VFVDSPHEPCLEQDKFGSPCPCPNLRILRSFLMLFSCLRVSFKWLPVFVSSIVALKFVAILVSRFAFYLCLSVRPERWSRAAAETDLCPDTSVFKTCHLSQPHMQCLQVNNVIINFNTVHPHCDFYQLDLWIRPVKTQFCCIILNYMFRPKRPLSGCAQPDDGLLVRNM